MSALLATVAARGGDERAPRRGGARARDRDERRAERRSAGRRRRALGPPAARARRPGERLADAVGDRLHLERRARHVLEHLVRGRPLAQRPQLAEERAGLAMREPVAAEPLAQVVAELRLERPRAQVRGDVEAAVDVRRGSRVGLGVDLQRVAEDLDVAARASPSGRRRCGTRARRGASRSSGGRSRGASSRPRRELVGPREVEPPRQPGRLVGQVLEQHRPALGDGVVAEPALLDRQVARGDARSARRGRPRGRARASRRRRRSAGSRASTRSGTSIGAQNARGVFCSRCSTSSSTFSLRLAGRCRGRRASPRARAASGRPGTAVPLTARGRGAATSQRSRLVERRRRRGRGTAGRPTPRTAARSSRGTPRHWSASSSSRNPNRAYSSR